MKVEQRSFYSEKLERNMDFKVYGDRGKPMIVFPSSGGRFYEYEDFGMIDAVKSFIEDGLIQVYTVDSVDNESWLDKGKPASQRAIMHNIYEAYIIDEFIPFVKHHSNYHDSMIATGCSMGGYHSANFYFKHPDVFDTVVALSGIYDARFFVGENLNDYNVYTNSPIDYLTGMNDHNYLDAYRRGDIIICTGQGAWEDDSIRDTNALENILQAKNIPAWVDYWGFDVNHDWEWWRVQMPYFLAELSKQNKLEIR